MEEQKIKIIGVRKYEALKSFDLENINEEDLNTFSRQFNGLTIGEALKMISTYEQKFSNTLIDKKSVIKYFEDINSPKTTSEPIEMTKEWLYSRFAKHYRQYEGVSYSKNLDSLENLKPLIYYFIGDFENFKKCKNLSSASKPCFSKGLLIVGGYGNGKTSTMRAMEKSLVGTNVFFRTRSANDVVTMFESCINEFDKKEFWKKVNTGVLNFDDLLTEREASNYGKVDLFKDILEVRYSERKRTYASINYNDEYPEDLSKALEQMGKRYGSRVFDRIFSMFNIIEFKGKSHRV